MTGDSSDSEGFRLEEAIRQYADPSAVEEYDRLLQESKTAPTIIYAAGRKPNDPPSKEECQTMAQACYRAIVASFMEKIKTGKISAYGRKTLSGPREEIPSDNNTVRFKHRPTKTAEVYYDVVFLGIDDVRGQSPPGAAGPSSNVEGTRTPRTRPGRPNFSTVIRAAYNDLKKSGRIDYLASQKAATELVSQAVSGETKPSDETIRRVISTDFKKMSDAAKKSQNSK